MTRFQFGRATEARFLLDAMNRGLTVSKPFVEAPGYDFVVDAAGRLARVQVKGAHARLTHRNRRSPLYSFYFAGPKKYDFDILACWLADDGKWLFVPNSQIRRRNGITVGITSPLRSGIDDWDLFHRG